MGTGKPNAFTGSDALRYESVRLSPHAGCVSPGCAEKPEAKVPSADWLMGLHIKHMCQE